LETGTVDVADDRADPAAAAEVAEIRDRVQRAVRALPAGQRQAVAGFYLRGLTHAELAAELGIRVGAGLVEAGLDRAALRPRLSDLEPETTEATMTQTLIPMRVTDVHRLPADDGEVERHVVLLEEVDGERTLPIWIGPPEAAALAMTLQSVDLPRPLTHRFAAGLVEALGGTVRGCRITRLAEETFYAEVRMEGPSGAAVVDARPSDALTLALVAAAPVVVDAGVLDDVARRLPPDDLLENLTTAGGAQDVVARWMAGRPGR
jgi:bifunctional DNase/RNase